MLDFIALQFGGFYGGTVGNLLAYWEQAGVFSYVLPFLLIFAIVFGVLSRIQIFGDNKGLNTVVSLVIGLLALQFDLVPVFFSEIFPRVGVALSVILALAILIGIFAGNRDEKIFNYLLLAVGIISFIVVLVKTAGYLGWYSGYWWSAHWPEVLAVLGFFAVLGAVVMGVSGRRPKSPLEQLTSTR